MKQSNILWILLFTIFPLYDTLHSEAPARLPSVEEVFAGRSLDEIASEIKATEQLMQELHENGSPEMIAEFYKMIEETMAQMTDKDWEDIMGITNAVTPLITPEPTAQPTTIEAQEAQTTAQTTSIVATSALDEFKNLIDQIITRIDIIFQKINSSKATSQHVETTWDNKATFANLKRLIAHLRITRLAEKFIKDDAPSEIKEMHKLLQELLKTLHTHDESIKIEDTFGLDSSIETDKKHIKKVSEFLNSMDQTIDTLMPKLEKFLEKTDPEALLLAKESEQKTKKALTDATNETKRASSTIARPAPVQPSGARFTPSSTGNYGGGYPSNYADYSNYGNDYDQDVNEPSMNSTLGQGPAQAGAQSTTPAAKSEIAPKANESKSKSDSDHYANVSLDLQGHLEDYNTQHENSFINYLKKDMVDAYPDYNFLIGTQGLGENRTGQPQAADQTQPPANTLIQSGTTGSPTPNTDNDWVDGTAQFASNGFKPYTLNVIDTLKTKFTKEFDDAKVILTKAKDSIYKMTSDELTSLQSNKDLNGLESRLKRYQESFKDLIPKLNKKMQKNAPKSSASEMQLPATEKIEMQSETAINKYQDRHMKFIENLRQNVGDEIDALLSQISSIKRSAKRAATKKK